MRLKEGQHLCRIDTLPIEVTPEAGDPVVITILKSGFWKGTRRGSFFGYTPAGRVKVSTSDGICAYKAENVELVLPQTSGQRKEEQCSQS